MGKTKVAGENALIMLTYNFRRLLNLIGITLFQKLMKALKSGNLENFKQEIAEYLAVLHFFWASKSCNKSCRKNLQANIWLVLSPSQ